MTKCYECGKKRRIEIPKREVDYNLREYNAAWFCGKCAHDVAGIYIIECDDTCMCVECLG